MLVLDDGWFGKRDDDNSGLATFVNEKKMNGSMAQLAEKIHKMGMKFGLWFEPEMISETVISTVHIRTGHLQFRDVCQTMEEISLYWI